MQIDLVVEISLPSLPAESKYPKATPVVCSSRPFGQTAGSDRNSSIGGSRLLDRVLVQDVRPSSSIYYDQFFPDALSSVMECLTVG